jgi:hypothetical protein
MLTYRLTGTTEHSGSTTTNRTSLARTTHPQQRGAESSRTKVRLEDGAALLTCANVLDYTLKRNSTTSPSAIT